MNYEMSFCEKNLNELKNPNTAVPPLPKIHNRLLKVSVSIKFQVNDLN